MKVKNDHRSKFSKLRNLFTFDIAWKNKERKMGMKVRIQLYLLR